MEKEIDTSELSQMEDVDPPLSGDDADHETSRQHVEKAPPRPSRIAAQVARD